MPKKAAWSSPIVLFLSFLGIGFIPKAPGTAASIATLPILYLFILLQPSLMFLWAVFFTLLIASCLLTEKIQVSEHLHDPQWIVIDEVLGMMITWLICPVKTLPGLVVLLLFFRFFDIVKIWPASFFDRKVKHGAGTILDDIVSGVYSGVLLVVLKNFLNLFPYLQTLLFSN